MDSRVAIYELQTSLVILNKSGQTLKRSIESLDHKKPLKEESSMSEERTITVKKILWLRMPIRIQLDLYPDRAGPRNPVRAGYLSSWSRKIFHFFYRILRL